MSDTDKTASADGGSFTPESLQMPDSLFDDDGEQSGTGDQEGADGSGTDDKTPPATDGDSGAKDGSEGSNDGQQGDGAGNEATDGDGDGDKAKDGDGQDKPASIEVDGEQYTVERIKELKEGSLRWNDYTKKTTELSETRKSVEAQRAQLDPFLQWIGKVKTDSALVDDIREALPEDQREIFEAALKLDTSKFQHPDTRALNEMRAEHDEMKARQALDSQAKDLVAQFGVPRDTADRVIEAAVEHFEKTGVYRTPEDQYKLMLADGLIQAPAKKGDDKTGEGGDKGKGDKPTPKPPKVPPKGGSGAKDIKPPARGGFETVPISAFKNIMDD